MFSKGAIESFHNLLKIRVYQNTQAIKHLTDALRIDAVFSSGICSLNKMVKDIKKSKVFFSVAYPNSPT